MDCSSQSDNEAEIGQALEEIFSDWIVNRPDVFVTAKLQEGDPSRAEEAVQSILARLRVKYVDLLLLPVDSLGPKEMQASPLPICCSHHGCGSLMGLNKVDS